MQMFLNISGDGGGGCLQVAQPAISLVVENEMWVIVNTSDVHGDSLAVNLCGVRLQIHATH